MRKDGKESLQHEARIKLYVERTGKERPKQIPVDTDPDDNIPLAELINRRNVWKSTAEERGSRGIGQIILKKSYQPVGPRSVLCQDPRLLLR